MGIKTDSSSEQKILEVSERLFLEKGFALTSTTEIAKEVGCNQALVHYYFRTKDNLFNTIFENKFKLFFQHVFELNKLENLPFEGKLKLMIESHFDLIKENPKLPLLIINEMSRQPERLKLLREKLHALPEQLFEQLNSGLQIEITAGRVRSVSLLDLIATIISLNVSLFLLMPVAGKILNMNNSQKEMMYQHRRTEHVTIILNYLKL
jgi:AcrR family transcriptional regulator